MLPTELKHVNREENFTQLASQNQAKIWRYRHTDIENAKI